MADGSAPGRPEDLAETERWEADKRRTAVGAPKPYTEEDVNLVAVLIHRGASAFPCECRSVDPGSDEEIIARAVLDALAEAGRLRRPAPEFASPEGYVDHLREHHLLMFPEHRIIEAYQEACTEIHGVSWSLVGESRRLALQQQLSAAAEFWLTDTEEHTDGRS